MSGFGRFESKAIEDGRTAQTHYENRELTERNLPMKDRTVYNEDYPAHEGSHTRKPFSKNREFKDLGGNTASSLYQQDYPGWTATLPGRRRPEPVPMSVPLDARTTYGADYLSKKPNRGAKGGEVKRPWIERPFDGTSSYQSHYTGDQGPKTMSTKNRAMPPRDVPLNAGTTYNSDFQNLKPNPNPRAPRNDTIIAPRKFSSQTTTGEHFKGFKLPAGRGNLGVESVGDRMHVLIPKTANYPSSGKHVFSTYRDNQREMCVLVFYGNSLKASENKLLGQFDMINIPPAPKQVPAMEVTFHVDSRGFLTADAKDLDTQRQKMWTENGGAITVR